MSNSPLTWPEIIELFRDPVKPTDRRLAVRIAEDFGLSSFEVARVWYERKFVPVWYWPRLIDLLEQRFGIVVSCRQLVDATIVRRTLRTSRQKDAA